MAVVLATQDFEICIGHPTSEFLPYITLTMCVTVDIDIQDDAEFTSDDGVCDHDGSHSCYAGRC